METNNKKLWFRNKLYGWGWTPCTWQGWLVLLVWVIIFYFLVVRMEYDWLKYYSLILFSVGVLIWICYKKGEKPKWQWGKRRE